MKNSKLFLLTVICLLKAAPVYAGLSAEIMEYAAKVLISNGAEQRVPEAVSELTRAFKVASSYKLESGASVLKKELFSGSETAYSPYIILNKGDVISRAYRETGSAATYANTYWVTLLFPVKVAKHAVAPPWPMQGIAATMGLDAIDRTFKDAVAEITHADPMFKMAALKDSTSIWEGLKNPAFGHDGPKIGLKNNQIHVGGEPYYTFHFWISKQDELPHTLAFLKKMSELKVMIER